MKKIFFFSLTIICALGLVVGTAIGNGSPGDSGQGALSQEELETIKKIREGLAGSTYLDGLHVINDVHCADCHGVDQPGWNNPVESAQCLSCHGTREEVASLISPELSGKWGNPHQSHLGDLDCWICHKGHQPSSVYCLGCHTNAPFTIPGQ